MNAGFSSLTALKAHLLHADLRAETGYDVPILQLGLGVAGTIEGLLNRKLGRVVGDTYITRGGRGILLLPRYPLETVTTLEGRISTTDAWTVQDSVDWYSAESGVVHLSTVVGTARWQLRATYTGGYWWATDEGDEPSVAIGILTRSATVTLPAGTEGATISFAEVLPFAPTSVSISLLVPAGQPLISAAVVAGSLLPTSFSITLAAPLPDDYELSYNAIGDLYSPAGNTSTLPEGATALPDAIRTAWLLQVEHLWRAHDKLGLSITKEPTSMGGTAALSSAELLPIVKDMLRDHIRYAL